MFPQITPIEIGLRLVVSLMLGFVIGWEREVQKKPAGLRTQMLVALGSAGFTILSIQLFQSVQKPPIPGMDPLRIINGIMEGLGFLGAGCIIQARGSVEGVTTAATIWVVGAMGLACGAGNYYLAFVITLLAFTVLTLFRIIEHRVLRRELPE
jgi:putative Mg2+ transporter-C (MgtC) family protein